MVVIAEYARVGTVVRYRGYYGEFDAVVTGGYYPSFDEELIPFRDDEHDSVAIEAIESTMADDDIERFPWRGRAFCPSVSEIARK